MRNQTASTKLLHQLPELNICYSIKYIAVNLAGQRWSVRPVSRLTVDLDFLSIPENIHQGP
jgi:hypothetical protein